MIHTRKCSQCNGDLTLIEKRLDMMEGVGTPVTRREYKCMDPACQGRKDKEQQARITASELKANKRN